MSIPEMKPVASSQIEAIGYDEENRTLHVRFKSGGHYSYPDTSPEDHEALIGAKSIGSHFGKNIRGRAFVRHALEPKE